jgi:hypothetical protein
MCDICHWLPSELASQNFRYSKFFSPSCPTSLLTSSPRRNLNHLQRIQFFEDLWHFLKNFLKEYRKWVEHFLPHGMPVQFNFIGKCRCSTHELIITRIEKLLLSDWLARFGTASALIRRVCALPSLEGAITTINNWIDHKFFNYHFNCVIFGDASEPECSSDAWRVNPVLFPPRNA